MAETAPRIRILPDQVANQIAAGEVIERPVAVIKELVENSLDAGASNIEVEFRNGGKAYMRVQDDGCGMDPDTAMLSLERHATSKIASADDLNSIRSFGFRGEALPSVASVSKFTLRSRARGLTEGTEIRINGGKLLERKACGMPVGTVVEVSNLFNTVPARRKFLKTDQTESAHIIYLARLCAVAHPQVAFRLLDNGRVVFQSPACLDLRERISEIWGPSLANDLIPIEWQDEKNPEMRGMRLHGLIARPGQGRATRRDMITLVNQRPVESRTLGYAIIDAFHGYLPRGRFPPTFLFLEIEPAMVDVNVHPAKREVRFRSEGTVRRFVVEAIADCLSRFQESRKIDLPQSRSRSSEVADAPEVVETDESGVAINPVPSSQLEPRLSPKAVAANQSLPTPAALASTAANKDPVMRVTPSAESAPHSLQQVSSAMDASPSLADWRYIGRMGERLALLESSDGLVLLNLPHARQRVRFETIVDQIAREEAGAVSAQSLLLPIALELEPLLCSTLEKHREMLARGGFVVEPFGRHFFRIEAIPAWLDPGVAEALLRDTLEQLRETGGSANQRLASERFARLAAVFSTRRESTADAAAVMRLLSDLLNCEHPHTCPRGRPTMQLLTHAELNRRFESARK
jgi:DNA mismatch repair protein MutL